MKKWYQNSHFRNLVDMHIPSGEGNLEKFDPEKYAECMELAGVDTAYVYASNCLGLCLFPTVIGYRHSVTYKRDIFGETVAALRRRGIGVVGYLNSWCTEGARMHPDWQIRSQNGRANGDNSRFGVCCVNSPYGDMFRSLVYEMVSKYDIDGLWVDMVGFWPSDCTCSFCRQKYMAKTGCELPKTINWSDGNFLDYNQFRYDSIRDYTQGIVDAAHSAKPHVTTSIQCAGWSRAMYQALNNEYFATMDYVSGDFYSDRNKTDVVCRLLPNLSQNLPFEYMISRAPDLEYHTALKDRSEILLQAFTSLLCGGSFLFIDAIDPDGGLNEELYRMMGEIKTEIDPFIRTVDYRADVIRDVAVYINFDSFTSRDSEGAEISRIGEFQQIPKRLERINVAFSRAHIDYDIITEKNIDDLSGYKLVVVSDLYRMNQNECERLRAYVRNGGRLYISGCSSALSADGANRDSFMLGDVTGVEYSGFDPRVPVYAAPTEKGRKYFARFSSAYPAMYNGAITTVKNPAAGTEILATLTYPYTDKHNWQRYSSAISNPPAKATDIPVVVRNKYGNGSCVYSAAPFETDSAVCSLDIFTAILKGMLDDVGGLTLECDESDCLEHVLRHSAEKRHYTVSLLNYQTLKKIVPMHDVEFSLKLDIDPVKVYTNLGRTISCEKRDGRLLFRLDRLDIYDVVYIEY